jgi:Na+/proline symporter
MTDVRASVESHLGSHDVSRVLYGTIVGLALVLALEEHAHDPGQTAGFIFGTALAIGLADLFADAISLEARTRTRLRRRDVRPLARDALAVVIGAGFPAIYFVLAAVGILGEHSAFQLAKWTGLALVCGYAFLAARMAGLHWRHATRDAAIAGVLGIVLVELKALLH